MSDERRRQQQEAGLAALLSLAISTASTGSFPAIPDASDRADAGRPSAAVARGRGVTGSEEDQGGRRWKGLLSDHLVRNSLFLLLSTGVQAALGAAFWVVAARFFHAADVGRASSLISATGLIAYLALLGLNTAVIRYLPTTADRDKLITSALLLVGASGAIFGLVYLLLTPAIAPRLAFVATNPLLAGSFMLLTGATSVNLLTDSVFITSRKASYTAITDGGVAGVAKIVLAVVLAGGGAYGLYSASIGGVAAAALVSVALIFASLRWRPSLRNSFQVLKPLLRFSAASYTSSILSVVPTMAVPLIALDRLGPAEAGYYFVAYQMASLVYAASYAVGQSFMAEGSYGDVDPGPLLRRSLRVLVALVVPGSLALIASAHWVLLAFGQKYSQHGTLALIVLVAAATPIALNNWLGTVLRLFRRLRPIIVSSGVYAVGVCGSAWFLAPLGLGGLTSSWAIGSALAAAASAVPCRNAVKSRRASARARHRRQAGAGSRPVRLQDSRARPGSRDIRARHALNSRR